MQPLLEAGTPALPSSVREVRVDHHRHVDVVEVAEPQQLGLAAEELELARPRLAHAPLDVAVLLGRHREEDHAAGQVLGRLASSSPIAAPSMPATCALWPHAWAAPVAGSASGCPVTTSPSSSPSSAKVGPSPARPGDVGAHAR